METFFASNPGLSSRVAHPVKCRRHTHEELTPIAQVMLVQDAHRFDDEARKAFADYLELRIAQPRFVNARSVRNVVERAHLRDCPPPAQALIGLRTELDQGVPPSPVRAEVTRFLRAATGDRPVP
jgi:hypothetical protein